ncbi:ABC transporter ATP-binding protein [Aurantimonas sp. VKM B-3413]|uniref:ABC transporter ATP-binding protein n=1 Tax=Aurantimonas sp. VKM B-3413 TaxID=2779401 RepID=UPI001E6147E8|nr:ABC transporter ATP-binding protein [Aurantimonas sp. VKM B-3413]MCB8840480.1 ABC transporter ATP-binding protein [Aurantimonas sp. VKM B-3413]
MARIHISHVEKDYGALTVLHDCNLDIHDNEFLVLVGPSGSGKTTLLRLIAGLETISRGDLYFDDQLVNDLDVSDRDIAMVFQNYGLYPHMSVYDNMAFGLRRRGLEKSVIDEKVRSTADLLNLGDYLKRRPKQLSGGQRQRVALGRAIVRDPEVFLLDEPLSNLDAQLRVQMRSEILRVHRRVDATAVYVTHDQVEAMTMGDRIVVMHEGRIQQVGTPEELYDRPVNRFVAEFIGTPAMGILKGEVERESQSVRVRTPAGTLPLSPEQARLIGVRDRVILGIRPEHLHADETGEDARLSGAVDVAEMLGAEQVVHFFAADESRLSARLPRGGHYRTGEAASFSVDTSALHFFDAATERRIHA